MACSLALPVVPDVGKNTDSQYATSSNGTISAHLVSVNWVLVEPTYLEVHVISQGLHQEMDGMGIGNNKACLINWSIDQKTECHKVDGA